MSNFEWFKILLLIAIFGCVALIAIDVHNTIGVMQLQEMI